MIYFGCFITSVFFYVIGEIAKKKYTKFVLYMISIMLPVFLAAYRAVDVGTDIKTYVQPSYIMALRIDSFVDFIKSNFYVSDILFNFVVYFCTKYFNSLQVVLGAIQLIISIPVYIFIGRKVDEKQRGIALLTYYFIFFGLGLNIMRQSMAMSIMMLAVSYFIDRKKFQFIICFLVAFGFHKSALFGLVLIVMYLANEKFKEKWFPYLCALLIALVICFYQYVMTAVVKMLPTIFGGYNAYLSEKNNNWPVTDLILYMICACIGIYLLKSKDIFERYLGLMAICSIAGVFISKSMIVAGRIMIYCNYFSIYTFALTNKLVKKNKYNIWIEKWLIFLIILIYWFVKYIFLKDNQIYPYKFVERRWA